MSNTVIEIENLIKEYKLGVISHHTLYKDVQSMVSRILKKEDPNAIIGLDVNRTRGSKFFALDDVSYSIKQGEVIGVIGKNGAGKSTLLKILSRVTGPTSGSIKIKGRIASLLEVGTGFHPELTGRENVYLNGAILGMRKKEITSKFDEIVNFSGVEEFIDTPVKRYSSGMYVRLAFAVAAHLEPEILIVDEVLAVGDMEFQAKCLGKMKDVSTQGRTVIFVSHNMDAVDSLCTKCIYMDKGKFFQIGPTNEITSLYLNKAQGYVKQGDSVNSYAEISRVYYTDDRFSEKNVFEYSESILIHIEYIIIMNLVNSNIWFDIRRDGKVVFASSDCDVEVLNYNEKTAGKYKATIRIPGHFLNSGMYDIVVGIDRYSPSVAYDRIENIALKIVDSSTTKIPEFYERKSLIKPLFKWDIIIKGA